MIVSFDTPVSDLPDPRPAGGSFDMGGPSLEKEATSRIEPIGAD
jgi:hypothetical protein